MGSLTYSISKKYVNNLYGKVNNVSNIIEDLPFEGFDIKTNNI